MRSRAFIFYVFLVFALACQKESSSHTVKLEQSKLLPGRIHFEVIATTYNPRDAIASDVPVISLGDDANIEVLLRIDKVIKGQSPFHPGAKVALMIHSPTLLYGGYGFDGKQYLYSFDTKKSKEGNSQYWLMGLKDANQK